MKLFAPTGVARDRGLGGSRAGRRRGAGHRCGRGIAGQRHRLGTIDHRHKDGLAGEDQIGVADARIIVDQNRHREAIARGNALKRLAGHGNVAVRPRRNEQRLPERNSAILYAIGGGDDAGVHLEPARQRVQRITRLDDIVEGRGQAGGEALQDRDHHGLPWEDQVGVLELVGLDQGRARHAKPDRIFGQVVTALDGDGDETGVGGGLGPQASRGVSGAGAHGQAQDAG
jgi:hypothetical protein